MQSNKDRIVRRAGWWIALAATTLFACDDGEDNPSASDGGGGAAADMMMIDGGGGAAGGTGGDGGGGAGGAEVECGNGEIEEGEQCDDGNTDDGDGCSADCQDEPPAPECGNGEVEDGETCDDGNTDAGDGCDAECQLEMPMAECGNGEVEDGEACDDGNLDNGDGCDMLCQVEMPMAECGNGEVEDGEACDDGNLDAGDGCDAACMIEIPAPECGNGEVEEGEACDDGNVDAGDGCDAECQIEIPAPVCGNGEIEVGEGCDDGNVDAGDGCDAECQIEGNLCGNGELDEGEACDPGLDINCDVLCTPSAYAVDRGRETVAPITTPAGAADTITFTADGPSTYRAGAIGGDAACPDGLTFTLSQGDAEIVAGACPGIEAQIEAGDYQLAIGGAVQFDGLTAGHYLARDVSAAGEFAGGFGFGGSDTYFITVAEATTVTFETSDGLSGCGFDSHLYAYSADMNGIDRVAIDDDDDGGTSLCSQVTLDLEPGVLYEVDVVQHFGGLMPAYFLNVRFGTCGDGEIQAGETCDDGNADGGDGCSTQCLVEPACGNGEVERGEQCDDGNLDAEDGCDAECQREPTCGDGFVDGAEECDDSNVEAGDGCDAECQREPVCGDGFIDAPEQCDDDNAEAGDGCDAACMFEQTCGNGVLEGTEECDDGNLINGDGCDILCTPDQGRIEAGIVIAAGLALAADGGDAFGFDAENDSHLTVSTTDAEGGCPGDTRLVLLDADGAEVANNDDSDDAAPCSALDLDIGPGAYTVRAESVAGPLFDVVLVYRLEVDITAGGDFLGGFGEGGDDLYVIDVAEPGTVTFETGDGLGGCPPGDTYMRLFGPNADGDQEQIAFSDDGGQGVCSKITQVFEAAGRYEVRVSGYSNRAHPGYRLLVNYGVCGDDALDAGEACDDGNTDAGDGCSAQCRVEPVCGNGELELGEYCDDGGVEVGDGCDAECQREPACGDGFVDDGEFCDDGGVEPGDGCDAECQREPACGDTFVDEGEQCDDGNLDVGDGCDAACQFEQTCGNGEIEGTETCDDGNVEAGDGCSDVCVREPVCGDGVLDPDQGEQCDDGNLDVGDGCDADCQFEQVCGNGEIEGTETCDDGNLDAGDGCDADCTVDMFDIITGEASVAAGFGDFGADTFMFRADGPGYLLVTTGDGEGGCPGDTVATLYGFDENGERVELASNDDLDDVVTCSEIEFDLPEAGDYVVVVNGYDGVTVPAYTFDFYQVTEVSAGGQFPGAFVQDGDDLFELFLDAPARVQLTTGDGQGGCPGDTRMYLYAGEEQIGFNDDHGDFGSPERLCSQLDVELEAGFYLVRVEGFLGRAIDGYTLDVLFGGECGDGVINVGETCDNGPDAQGDFCDVTCQLIEGCGNAVVEAGEQCDDGNIEAGDGCDAACQREVTCGDGFVDAPERCDDGNLVNGDGCSDTCVLEQECGNGIVEADEQCDDGNLDNDDGCDSACTDEIFAIARGRATIESKTAFQATDRVFFSVDGPARVTAFTGDGEGGCPEDTRMFLDSVDAEGNRMRVAVNDDADGRGVCSQIDFDFDAAGDYVFVVEGAFGRPVAAYTFDFLLTTDIQAGGDFVGGFPEDGDDLYTFTLDAPTHVALGTSDGAGGCPGDTRLEVLREGERAAYNDDLPFGDPLRPCSGVAQVFGPGTYTVKVDGFGGAPVEAYTLSATFGAICGDGEVGETEGCDDGNLEAGDGCSPTCTVEPCGDGEIGAGEECDDGNLEAGDGCDATCQREPVCGDTFVDEPETCDDGNVEAGDGCSADCQIEPGCGNGQLDDGEECEDGNLSDNDTCAADCTIEAATPIAAPGASVEIAGSLDDVDGQWARPGFNCAGSNADRYYDAYRIVNETGADQVLTITAAWGGDSYLFVYEDPFDAMAGAGCLAFNDDFGGFGGSQITDVVIPAGATLVVVASSYGANSATGAYTLDIATQAPPAVCGNGAVEDGEQCDDGNVEAGDGCDDACQREATCGDGFVDVPETCDDGNVEAGDGCDAECQLEAACGNGQLDDGEDCDDGNLEAGDGCAADCTIEPCGNGQLDGDEACDDGNLSDNDTCDAACQIEAATPIAGVGEAIEIAGSLDDTDGQWARPGFNCAGANADRYYDAYRVVNETGADQMLTITAAWGGDSYLFVFEDPFDAMAGAGCLAFNDDFGGFGGSQITDVVIPAGATLVVVASGYGANAATGAYTLEVLTQAPPAVCGNGAIEAGETCDDGNVDAGDGCDDQCQIEPFCGDGNVDAGEECDDGNTDPGDGCDATCQREQECGDGFVDAPEECDDGNVINGDGCTATCEFEVACGNGNIDADEECDDGNVIDGDTCAADCTVEAATPIAAPEGTIELVGSLDDTDGQWSRPNAACAGANADRYFDAYRIVNETGADQTLTVTGAWGGDSYLHVYQDPFDATSLDGCVIGDDDFNGTGGSQITDVAIPAGGVLVVVASGYGANSATGAYTIEVLTQALPPVCGNGELEEGEACDDGNLDAGDGCDAACQLEPVCGNAQVDDGEECDDGNDVEGDGCDNACTIDRFTIDNGRGDYQGRIRGGSRDYYTLRVETAGALDAFTSDGGVGCPGDTVLGLDRVEADGTRTRIRGNNNAGGGVCSRVTLNVEPGDYEIVVGHAAGADLDYVLTVRLTADVNGGGTFAGGFQDGGDDYFTFTLEADTLTRIATNDGADGCPGDTRITVTQNGNPVASHDDIAGAANRCSLIEQVFPAGTYLIQVDGFGDVDDYRLDVVFAGPCGDGIVGLGEGCDDGNNDAGDGCAADCTIEPFCGDGVLNPGEECDDGNNQAGDGCSADCANEVAPLPIGARGESVEIQGSLDDGDRLWTRPSAGCVPSADTNRPYDTVRIVNDTAAAQIITITAAWAGDGYLHVFEDPFDPIDINGCVAGDDDFGVNGSQITDLEIQPGQVLVLVASSYSANAYIGAWTLTIETAIPPACGNGILEEGEVCDDGNLVNGDGCDAACTEEAFAIVTGRGQFTDGFAAGSTDTYAFSVETAGTLTASVTDGNGACPGDVVIDLLDANGDVAATFTDGGVDGCPAFTAAATPADWSLRVRGGDGAVAIAAYELDFLLVGDLGRGGDFAGGLELDGSDLFSLTLYGPGEVNFVTSDGAGGCAGDTNIFLSQVAADGSLTPVGSNDDGGVGTCSDLTRTIGPGTYVLEVVEFNGNPAIPDYTLTVTLPEGDAACAVYAACLDACAPNDFVCLAGCGGTPATFAAVANCATTNGCADLAGNYDLDCMAEFCPDELSACFGPAGPAN